MYNFPDDSLVLHTDLYQINMLQTYWKQGIDQKTAVFEGYFRENPFNNGFAIFAGLERIVQYLNQLQFTDSDIDYLRSIGYEEDFLNYLKEFKFTCNVRMMQEGELCFASYLGFLFRELMLTL